MTPSFILGRLLLRGSISCCAVHIVIASHPDCVQLDACRLDDLLGCAYAAAAVAAAPEPAGDLSHAAATGLHGRPDVAVGDRFAKADVHGYVLLGEDELAVLRQAQRVGFATVEYGHLRMSVQQAGRVDGRSYAVRERRLAGRDRRHLGGRVHLPINIRMRMVRINTELADPVNRIFQVPVCLSGHRSDRGSGVRFPVSRPNSGA